MPEGKLNCKELFWWEGLQLVPPHHQQGLLDHIKTPIVEESPRLSNDTIDESSEELSSSESMSGSSHSEESHPMPQTSVTKTNKKRQPAGKLWQMNLSARSNQDVQRSNEERLIQKMIDYLAKKTSYSVSGKAKGR